MAITHATPPAPSLDVLSEVEDVHLGPHDQSLHIPHKVYNLDLDDLLAGRGFAAAYLTGWRYVFRDADGQYRVVEISADEADGTHTFSHINSGDHVDNLVALHHDGPPAAQDEDYELAVLRVPACYVMAMWFTEDTHDRDFLVPLAPVHHNFAPNVSYPSAEFLEVLETTAREMADPAADLAATAPTPDDLARVVEGIGPQIAELLARRGITTFAELAASTPEQLTAILRSEGTRFNRADPATWPQQAALAAAGRWPELEDLQRRLTGGHQ